ncbi:MAG: Signal transduction histidine kinase [Ignavibacteria bacterium]|nr:MAG: Signal transduction histidine kinase [Ignavibacteria bacterium]KAF0160732.1 MAG: Signal transduction histidine kinase [Ignavibacteria bacterium]
MHTNFSHIEKCSAKTLDNFGFGVFRVDSSGNPVYANMFMLKLLGFESLEELQAGVKSSAALQKCFDPQRLSDFIKDSQKTFYEYRWTTKDNRKILLREFGHEVSKNEGTIFYDCVIEDISEKSLIDKLFQDIKSSDYSILKAIPDYILIVTRYGEIVESKNNFDQVFLGKPLSSSVLLKDIFDEEVVNACLTNIASTLQSGESHSFDFIHNLFGVEKYFEARFTIRGHDQALIILRDITQQKIAESQVLKFTEELKQLNSTKDKFFSIIGHDLRSPINGLLSYAEILYEEYDVLSKEEVKEFAGHISEIARTTNSLLNNLLEWSRIQSGKIAYEPQELLPYITVDKISRLLNAVASNKQIRIINQIEPELVCFADSNMLQSIILNLVSNAIKFSNAGGIIEISAVNYNEYVKISVKDYGVGIKEEHLKMLCDSNCTITTLGTAKEKGTGLGLMLCKEFVKMHKGNIWVESDVGNGAVFSFTLQKFDDNIKERKPL